MSIPKDQDKIHKTSIEDLPNELLNKILACISLKHDLDSVQHVSKRWYALVDETIGREIAISSLTSDDETIAACEYPCIPHAHLGCLGFDMISIMGVRTCYIELLDSDIENKHENEKQLNENVRKPNGFEALSTFKFPHLLKHLYFNGSIRSDLFHSLLKNTENLSMLQINLLALSQLVPEDLRNLRLPHLKALGVSKCLKPTGILFEDALGLPNLHVLLEESTFPNLGQLDIRFAVKKFNDFRTIKAILKFLTAHVMLTEISLIMEFPVQVDVLPNFHEELRNLTAMARKHRNRKSLKICEIQGIRIHASYPQIQIWLAFLEQQQCLKSLTLRLGYLPGSFLETVCNRNKSSLEYLFLYKLGEIMDGDPGVIPPDTVFDCKAFATATRLQTLIALGCDVVTNAKSLPPSLSSLHVSGVITSSDVEHIFFHLPELQFINLKNACFENQQNFGVNLNVLQRFIRTRKVKRMILNGSSLSENYPEEGLSNGDPENPSQLKEFEYWDVEHIYLDWELNREKYYVDKYCGWTS